MCDLTPIEHNILVNLSNKTKPIVASQLGISVDTLNVHLSRLRKKRAKCKDFLRKTDPFKRELYPKRRGE